MSHNVPQIHALHGCAHAGGRDGVGVRRVRSGVYCDTATSTDCFTIRHSSAAHGHSGAAHGYTASAHGHTGSTDGHPGAAHANPATADGYAQACHSHYVRQRL